VYALLGYPAGERGTIERLKEAARPINQDKKPDAIPNLFGIDEMMESADALLNLVIRDREQLTEDELNWLNDLCANMKLPRLTRPPIPERARLLRNERSPNLNRH
jgi:hypothetical protein